VPPPTPEMQEEDPSLIVVEPYKELPVDQGGFVGKVPEIVGMEPCDNFELYTARKLYLHNCGHAMLGYLGHQRGYTYGYEALADTTISPMLNRALAESKAGIVATYSADALWLEAYIEDVVHRFANRALADTVYRLARDPLRKLGPEDRLVGAARLSEQAGMEPAALCWGIAAGYCFDDARDPLAVRLQERIANEGLDTLLVETSGIDAGELLARLIRDRIDRLQSGNW
jgi:mannitol-1-phosphate 5-dehydrogenase